MFESYLIRYCAPTLTGLKTANLFHYPLGTGEEANSLLKSYNVLLNPKGVFLACICSCGGKALVYVFRPSRLVRDLEHPAARDCLLDRGYDCEDVFQAVRELSLRVQHGEGFPHEIGFFLGYPVHDVIGFIRYGGRESKCSGCWQVYQDVDRAKRQFERIHQCTRVYCKCYNGGATIQKLTVAC